MRAHRSPAARGVLERDLRPRRRDEPAGPLDAPRRREHGGAQVLGADRVGEQVRAGLRDPPRPAAPALRLEGPSRGQQGRGLDARARVRGPEGAGLDAGDQADGLSQERRHAVLARIRQHAPGPHPLERTRHIGEVERLLQEVDGGPPHRPRDRLRRGVAGDEDDRGQVARLLDGRHQVEGVALRQVQVEEDGVPARGPQLAMGVVDARHRGRRRAEAVHQPREHVADGAVVIQDEDVSVDRGGHVAGPSQCCKCNGQRPQRPPRR
jgi:hypothetical protein